MKHNYLPSIVLPSFEPFIVLPRNGSCSPVNPRDLIVEILGNQDAQPRLQNTQKSLTTEGSNALLFRCRRPGETEPRIAHVTSFDITPEGRIKILQLQGTKDRHVAYKFNSSFNIIGYVLLVMEETFLKSGVPVYLEQFPTGIEGASYAANSIQRYEILRTALLGRAAKYNLSQSEVD